MKRSAIAIGLLLSISPLLSTSLLAKSGKKNSRSEIVDFHPTTFDARTDLKFFYSIGRDLKYSNRIDPSAPTLISGKFGDFLVSPDGLAIAIVVDHQLVVVKPSSSLIRKIASVDSIYKSFKPSGRQFFRDNEFQWSRDSRFLYLMKDEYYESQGSQLFSDKGELWKYGIEDGSLQLVLKPFPAGDFFLGIPPVVYFTARTGDGGLQLDFFDGKKTGLVATYSSLGIPFELVDSGKPESHFYSYSLIDYERILLHSKRVAVDKKSTPEGQVLRIGKNTQITISQGKGWDGYYYCYETLRSVFLPGNRFFLLNTPYCGEFNGQLLIDTATGDYEELPKDTRVYMTLTTDTAPLLGSVADSTPSN